MSTDTSDRPVVVALFDQPSGARAAADALGDLGFSHDQLGLLLHGQKLTVSETDQANVSNVLALAASATDGNDVANVLLGMGVPAGEARFYAAEAHDGRSLLVVQANSRSDQVRKLLLERGGYDVQSRGGELIRAGEGEMRASVRPRPPDVTMNWQDVRSRYQMLFQQHYGTSDATWEQMEPVYEYAWRLANRSDLRGRAWNAVQSVVEGDWPGSEIGQSISWRDAAGPIRDVWDDVAEEAATGAEGGADRRIARQGADQSVAARDLEPPSRGAG